MSEMQFVNGDNKRKLKRKMEETTTLSSAVDSEVSLSLSLGRGISSSPFKSLKSNEEKIEYPCKFCNKKFSNSQALGGHQNAHRHERVISKIEKEFQMGTFGLLQLCPYSSIPNHHQYAVGSPFFNHQMHYPNVAPSWTQFVAPAGYANPFGMMNNSWGTPTTPQNNNDHIHYVEDNHHISSSFPDLFLNH